MIDEAVQRLLASGNIEKRKRKKTERKIAVCTATPISK